MPTDETIARLNAGTSMNVTPGSTGLPRLTNQEIAIAAGMIHRSFDHALMLSKQGAGLGGFTQGLQFLSLDDGAERIAWDLWLERKRPGNMTVTINRHIAVMALDEFMDPQQYRERSQADRAEIAGVSRAQWFKLFALHFADVLNELHTREANAYLTVRQMLRDGKIHARNGPPSTG